MLGTRQTIKLLIWVQVEKDKLISRYLWGRTILHRIRRFLIMRVYRKSRALLARQQTCQARMWCSNSRRTHRQIEGSQQVLAMIPTTWATQRVGQSWSGRTTMWSNSRHRCIRWEPYKIQAIQGSDHLVGIKQAIRTRIRHQWVEGRRRWILKIMESDTDSSYNVQILRRNNNPTLNHLRQRMLLLSLD